MSTEPAKECISRREAYLAAAQRSFFAHGYARTTMSAIAAEVGGSKTTLWSHFANKEELFVAMVDDIVEHFGQALSVELDPELPIDVMLRRFGMALLDTLLSEPIVALQRLVMGEAGRFPEIGALFYEHGPRRGKARLAAFVEGAMAAGRLRHGEPALAAGQFTAMCQSHAFALTLYSIDHAEKRDAAADVAAAVDTFMRAWGPE